jgi:hypothetical protein
MSIKIVPPEERNIEVQLELKLSKQGILELATLLGQSITGQTTEGYSELHGWCEAHYPGEYDKVSRAYR